MSFKKQCTPPLSIPDRVSDRKELSSRLKRSGYSPTKASKCSVGLAGKAGPMEELRPDLNFGELLNLWYGLRMVNGGVYRDNQVFGGMDVSLVDDEAKKQYYFSEEEWEAMCDHMNVELGITTTRGLPVFKKDLDKFLDESRVHRAATPHADLISKRAFHALGADNTTHKFSASYGMRDVVHLGAGLLGRLSCVGVENLIPIDPLLNNMRWQELNLEGKTVVSDVAMPNEGRNGMGRDEFLYQHLRLGKSLIKMNFLCLNGGDQADRVVYKGRPHNLEVIVATPTWPGVSPTVQVTEASIVEANGMRNIFCLGTLELTALQGKMPRTPGKGIFYTQEDVGRHLQRQLRYTYINKKVSSLPRRHHFDQELFDHLSQDVLKPFNPSALKVPQALVNKLKGLKDEDVKNKLRNSGLDAHSAANIYQYLHADRHKDVRKAFLINMATLL